MENFLRTRIRERLDTLGMNPSEAARQIGANKTFVHDLLIGKKETIRSPSILRLAKALDCDPEYLTGVQPSPRRGGSEAGSVGLQRQGGAQALMPVSGVVEPGAWRSIEATYPSLPVAPDPRFPAAAQRAYLVRGSHAEALGVADGDVLLAVADAGWRDGDVVIARRTRADGFEQELSVVRACADLAADAEVLARVICAYKVF